MEDVVAFFEIVGVRPNGEEMKIAARLGRPYRSDAEGPGAWACPVELSPLFPQLPDIRGIDSFHALWLAGSLVFKLLAAFKSGGGRLLNEDGSEFPLEAYASGLGESG
jgi:hypothetical protein